MIGSDILWLTASLAMALLGTGIFLGAPDIADTYYRFRDWYEARQELKRTRALWVRYAVIASELQEMRRG